LADLCGLSKGHLSTIEHGLASITIQTIERLAEGLGFAPLYLLAVGADDRTQAAELLRFLPNTEVRKLTQQLRAQIDRE
jgi:transcriptional regulator with XRE-family HTH domain